MISMYIGTIVHCKEEWDLTMYNLKETGVVRVGCPAGMAAIGQSRPEDEFEGRSAYQSAANALTIICGRPS
jgi:hypothetical protein